MKVNSRGHPVGDHRIDFIVNRSVVLEIKAVARKGPIVRATLISYLHSAKLRAGLLLNFNTLLLKDGIQRIVV